MPKEALNQNTLKSKDSQESGSSAGRSFARDVVLMLVLRFLVGASGFLSGLIVARWLGPEGLGILTTIQVAVLATVQLGSLGLPAAGTYFIAHNRQNLPPVVLNGLIYGLLAGSGLSVALVLIASFSEGLFGDIPRTVITVAAISIPFQMVGLLGTNVFLGVGKIVRFNLLEVAGQMSYFLSAIVTLVIFSAGLEALISVNTFFYCLLGLTVVLMVHRLVAEEQKTDLRTNLKLFPRLARYGIKFHVATVTGILVIRGDLLIVKYFHGAQEAGVYAVASQASLMIMMLPNIVATLLFPRVAAANDLSGRLTSKVTRHTALVMILICGLAVPVSFAIPLFFGDQFVDASIQLLILLPGVFLIGVESILVQHFSGTGLPAAIPLFWLLTLLVGFGLNLTLVPAYGGRGAALGSIVSYALIFALVATYFRLKTGRGFGEVLILRRSELRGLWMNGWGGFLADRSSNSPSG